LKIKTNEFEAAGINRAVLYLKTKFMKNIYLIVINLLFCVALSAQSASDSGTIVDSLKKKISTSLASKDENMAIKYYNDLFTVTYTEDNNLLKDVCLNIFSKVIDSNDNKLRLQSLDLMGTFVNKDMARILFKGFKEPDENIRKKIVSILSGNINVELFPEISTRLKSDDIYEVSGALELLGELKEKFFTEQVVKLLEHEDIVIKAKAIEVLGKLDPKNEDVDKLNKLLIHPSEWVRSGVVEAFCNLKNDNINIQPAVRDSSEKVQLALLKWAAINPGETADRIIRAGFLEKNEKIFSASCMAALKSIEMVERVDWSKLVGNKNEEIRVFAVNGLFKRNELFDDEELNVRLLNDTSVNVRSFVASKMIESENSFVKSLLSDVVENGSSIAKKSLINAWIEKPELGCNKEIVRKFVSNEDASIQCISVNLIAGLSLIEKGQIIKELLKSNKINVREAVYLFLAANKEKEIYSENFQKGLEDSSVKVQAAVIKGLNLLGDSQANSFIEKMFASKYKAVRAECVLQVHYFEKDETKLDWIEKGVKDASGEVRKAALDVAFKLEDKNRKLQLFSDMLFDDDEQVRRYALTVLQSPGAEVEVENKKKEESKVMTKTETEKTQSSEKQEIKVELKDEKPKNKLMDWLDKGKKKSTATVSLKREDEINKGIIIDEKSQSASKGEIESKLKKLLSSQNKDSAKVEDLLLELGDEAALSKLKNRLNDASTDERKEAAKKIGLLHDATLIPLLREQLQNETELQVKFELALAIWKMVSIK